MTQFDYKQFTERHRPHIHPPGTTLFVTYRLAGSIPRATVRLYKAKKEWLADQLARVERAGHVADEPALAELTRRLVDFNREWFIKYEDILHKATSGPMWMKNERAADAVAKSLHKLNGKAYRLDAFSVMSNHVHAVFQPFLTENGLHETMDQGGKTFWACDHPSLSKIMHSLKGSSAYECNLILSRTGQFWEHESFDHFVREGRFYATIKYVLNNPVKAGLVRDWRDWRWNFCRNELSENL